jgi:hypothetical protein
VSDKTNGASAADTPPQRSKAELAADIATTRDELRATLDAIEFRLNVPKQARHAAHRLKSGVNRFREANPVGFAVGVAAIAVAVTAAGVLGFRSAAKK